MQLDMHYHGTYAMARAAGLTPDAAKMIATCAQFVDDNVAQVTDSYEEARFSTHHLGEPDASRAERAADRVERRSGDDGAGR